VSTSRTSEIVSTVIPAPPLELHPTPACPTHKLLVDHSAWQMGTQCSPGVSILFTETSTTLASEAHVIEGSKRSAARFPHDSRVFQRVSPHYGELISTVARSCPGLTDSCTTLRWGDTAAYMAQVDETGVLDAPISGDPQSSTSSFRSTTRR